MLSGLDLARRRAHVVVRQLMLPDPWDINVFAKLVADQRGRPLTLVPRTMSEYGVQASALWVRLPNEDLIVYDDAPGGLYRENLILHEFGHILLGHGEEPLPPKTPLAPAASVVRHRQYYGNQEELDAEALAYEIWVNAGVGHLVGPAGRLLGAFEHRHAR
jgi:hypothetical protein